MVLLFKTPFDMNDLEDFLLGVDCDDWICDSLMYQKSTFVQMGSPINHHDGTYTQYYWQKTEPIKVSSKVDYYIYDALKTIQKKLNVKL
jgi:hypothetical protein